MIFSSFTFVAFFSIVMLLLVSLKTDNSRKNLLLIASCYFYAYWDWRFLALMLVPTMIDYIVAIKMEDSSDQAHRKRLLLISLTTNLGLLGFFKYFNFFIASANAMFAFTGLNLHTLHIILPVGISFYTFQTMSYTIDVYRRQLKAQRRLRDFALFVTFFPQLVAGPIVRASEFLPQLARPVAVKKENIVLGLQIFVIGMLKKMLFADNLAPFVDVVFASPHLFDSGTVWLATIAYSVQIFADFSGYSDMAIGIARCMGYELPVNFRLPYLATNITEFWHRWHITLSTWLRDYLYIPLGGNRKGPRRTYINLMITMLLGGLWHGASWNFIIWGALHGFGLALHKLFRQHVTTPTNKLWTITSWAFTYGFVLLGWVFFRAQTFDVAWSAVRAMFSGNDAGTAYYFAPFLYVLLPLTVMAHIVGYYVDQDRVRHSRAAPRFRHSYFLLRQFNFATAFVLTFLFLSFLFFSPVNTSPFVYFQF